MHWRGSKVKSGLVLTAVIATTIGFPLAASASLASPPVDGVVTINDWHSSALGGSDYDLTIGQTHFTGAFETTPPFVGSAKMGPLTAAMTCTTGSFGPDCVGNSTNIATIDGHDALGNQLTGGCGYPNPFLMFNSVVAMVSANRTGIDSGDYVVRNLVCKATYQGASQVFVLDENTEAYPAPSNILQPSNTTGIYCDSGFTLPPTVCSVGF